jgi:hypothetical protein
MVLLFCMATQLGDLLDGQCRSTNTIDDDFNAVTEKFAR